MGTNEYKLIEQAVELFTIREDPEQKGRFLGLLYPARDNSIFPYDRPALIFEAKIDHLNNCFVCIKSVDDHGVSIYSSFKDLERSTRAMTKFIEFIGTLGFRCPDKDELEKFCTANGFYASYWA